MRFLPSRVLATGVIGVFACIACSSSTSSPPDPAAQADGGSTSSGDPTSPSSSGGSRGTADSTFLLAVIDKVAASYSIDKTRVLLSGWSGGGFMSSAMACRFYASFRAIGIHSGGAPYDANGGPSPACVGASIATLVTHGGLD